MSRAAFATAEQIQTNFDKCLKDALELGIWPPSDQGFSNETVSALMAVARAYPNGHGRLVRAAKEALAMQLAGKKAAS